jgi:hypothetical protein
MIDRRFEMAETKRIQKQAVDKTDERIKEMDHLILEEMKKTGLEAARGNYGMASKMIRDNPQITDYDELIAHIKKTGEFELLQRRLGVMSVKERWEVGNVVPGVGHVMEVVLHWTAKKS